MGGAGDSPAPVGNLPTGSKESNFAKGPSLLARIVASVPSGPDASGDGTGVGTTQELPAERAGPPVLPGVLYLDALGGFPS